MTITDNTPGAVHAGGHDTEHEAAAAVALRSGTQRTRVLLAIVAAGPCGITDYEMERQLRMGRPSPGNRRGELVQAGLVQDTGLRRTTNTGCNAIVWAATPAGRAAAAGLE